MNAVHLLICFVVSGALNGLLAAHWHLARRRALRADMRVRASIRTVAELRAQIGQLRIQLAVTAPTQVMHVVKPRPAAPKPL